MAAARSRFLSADYYAPLRKALCALALEHAGAGAAVLDAGCGEGYYTAGLFGALAVAGRESRLAGVDLSKPSVRLAAKRLPHGEFAVASVYRLPVGRRQIDLLLNCFSPCAGRIPPGVEAGRRLPVRGAGAGASLAAQAGAL